MRYKAKGLEIKSENAAKSASQASQHLISWLTRHESVESGLDYGCGKLRYAATLAARCQHLTLVDSEIQLNRIQRVCGEYTSVRAYVESHWANARVMSITEFDTDTTQYDLALCANVLSAIPNVKVRSILLRNMRESLTPVGHCLFVTQYRNSYFTTVASAPNSIPHLDGWILKATRGIFYYGIIDREKLEGLLVRHGFVIEQSWTNGQSAYVLGANP